MSKPHIGSRNIDACEKAVNTVERLDGTQSIGRAVNVLRATAMMGRHGIRIDEIMRFTGMPKTTCARIVRRLMEEGLVEKDRRSHKIYLGHLLHQFGLLAQPTFKLNVLCGASLERLATTLQDMIYFSERTGLEAVTTERHLGSGKLSAMALDVGIRRPLGVAAGGVAILSVMDPNDSKSVIQAIGAQYNRYENLNPEIVLERVEIARSLGYAVGGAYATPGAKSVCVGFQIAGTQVAISATGLTAQWYEGRDAEVATAIVKEVETIKRSFSEGKALI